MNDRAELDRFAELLVRLVRDESIATCDALAARRMGGPDGKRWRDLLDTETAQRAVQELIPDVVDQVLFQLLNAIDQGDLPVAWRLEDGSCTDLYDLGRSEMAGWLLGSDGWRARYSGQRHFEPGTPPGPEATRQ